MKSRSFLVSIILVLVVSTTFLLWYGETTIGNKANAGYSVFSFLDSSNLVKAEDSSALDFEIVNLEKNEIEYSISTSLNDVEIFSQKFSVKSKGSLKITPDKSILEKATPNTLNTYMITIKWDNKEKNKEILKKQFKLLNEEN